MSDALAQLSNAGVAVWLDDLSRSRLESGHLAMLVRNDGVVGVTTNPSIFCAAITAGGAYDDQIADLSTIGVSPAASLSNSRPSQSAGVFGRPRMSPNTTS